MLLQNPPITTLLVFTEEQLEAVGLQVSWLLLLSTLPSADASGFTPPATPRIRTLSKSDFKSLASAAMALPATQACVSALAWLEERGML